MWCYQRPGFEAHLLTELQRQQQCGQFCDTLLKAEGVSVPAHSCILSAISPHISSALSSTPAPPAGQSRLLEFQALGACTLLHMVSLLYSGEMAGEGESEKQQAIYAASKLGINELVEVTNRKSRGGEGEMSQYVEVGVQTEENEATYSRWRREVRDGNTYLWKETLSDGGKDTWTQTEEINVFPSAQPVATYETIDLGALQSLNQTDSHQFVPITVIYPPNENQTIQVSSDASNCVQESAGSTPVAVVAQPYPSVPATLPYHSRQTEPQSYWAAPQGGHVTIAEAWEGEQIEQFEGNIAEFLNSFLNSESNQGTRRGKAARRQRGRARRAGEGQQRARRPRGRPAGRGRGRFTQMVDVQEVGVGKLQKLFLDRWRVRTPRTGQGGGAVGRKLYLKTRGVQQPARRYQRRGRGKVLEVCQSQDMMLRGGRGEGNTQQGPKNTPKQFKQFNSVSASSASGSNLHPSLSLLSPAACYVSPASSLLHTTHLPNPAPPLYEVQSEPIDHLLEEVMMGLDILPNNSSKAAHSRCRRPASSHTFSFPDSFSAQNKQQVQTTDGELNEILENLLQSFEQHVENCNTTQERDDGSSSENQIVQSKPKRALPQTGSAHTSHLQHKETSRQVSRSEKPSQNRPPPHKALDHRAASSKHSEKTQKETKTRRLNRKRTKQYLFSLEKKTKKSVSSRERKTAVVFNQKNKQLQQKPVVRLDRNTVMLQGQSCRILEDQSPSKAKSWVSSVKSCFDKNLQANWQTKCYPIRSRIRQGQITNVTFLEEPLLQRPGTLRKNKQLPSSAVQPQRMDSSQTDDQSEENQERNGDLTVLPQEEAPAGMGQKRGAESDEETNEDAPLNKRIRLDKTTCEPSTPTSEASDFAPAAATIEQEAVMVVETVSLSLKECFQETKPEEEPGERLKGKEMSSDEGEGLRLEQEQNHLSPEDRSVSLPHPDKEICVARTGKSAEDVDEDIDVTGGSSPVPDPVTISWTESSEGEAGDEDKEVDVVGDKMD